MNHEMDRLSQISLFQTINKTEIESILKCLNSKSKEYQKNQTIIMAGSEITSLGILLTGNARIIREDIMGNRMIVASLKAGEIFGETFACGGIAESPVSVFAIENSKVLWVPIKGIVNPCSTPCQFHSVLITNLLQLLARKNLYLNHKMELLSKRTIREKIIAFLTAQAQEHRSVTFEISLNRNELADYLCVDRSAMSRELSRLKDEGVITYNKKYFELKNISN